MTRVDFGFDAATVVPLPGADLGSGDVEAWAAERLAPYKRPSRIVAMDALPASPTGKLLKSGLRALAAEVMAA